MGTLIFSLFQSRLRFKSSMQCIPLRRAAARLATARAVYYKCRFEGTGSFVFFTPAGNYSGGNPIPARQTTKWYHQ
jgi:hypothetical protein